MVGKFGEDRRCWCICSRSPNIVRVIGEVGQLALVLSHALITVLSRERRLALGLNTFVAAGQAQGIHIQ